MGVELFWHVPNRVAIARSYGINTLEDALAIHDWLNENHTLESNQRFHLISDASAVETNKMSMMDVKVLSNRGVLPSLGYIILINNGRLKIVQNMLMAVASQILGIRFRSVDSLDEALKFLEEIDPTLVAVPQNA